MKVINAFIHRKKNACLFLSYRSLTSNCEQFVPLDLLYKCVLTSKGKGCFTETKDCTELSAGQCDLFNTEEILDEVGKKMCRR